MEVVKEDSFRVSNYTPLKKDQVEDREKQVDKS